MDIGRQVIGFIESADTDEFNQRAGPGIVAPYGNPALRTTRNQLPIATRGRRLDQFRFRRQQHNPVRFDHGIERE